MDIEKIEKIEKEIEELRRQIERLPDEIVNRFTAAAEQQIRPKKEYRKSELIEMGYPEKFLERAYRDRGQKIAHKISPKRNSPIIYDIEELERYRKDSALHGKKRVYLITSIPPTPKKEAFWKTESKNSRKNCKKNWRQKRT